MTPSFLDPGFLLVLLALALVVRVCPPPLRLATGALVSIAVLGVASPPSLFAILGLGLLVIYPAHRAYVRAAARGASDGFLRALQWGTTGVLVAAMVAFKVLQMPGSADSPTVGSLSRTSAELFGFSYFLFRALNFVFMQRIAKLDERNPLAVAYYFLFLPTLTSGPIQKYLDFRQQVNAVPAVSWAMTGDGLYRIVRGFFRKIVLAATLDQVVLTQLASAALAPWQSALIVVGLYLFFYFDFAGYSDIAIGFGLLLGIRVPENFRQPFLATTLTEFWRNWHISLVDWLRDHVFIPLGGMRAERKRAGLLALLVMLLCGLWHGITWPFLLWGLWHGGHMMAESLLGVRPIPRASQRGARYFGMVAWTNLRVALGALLFLPSLSDIGRVLGGFVP